MKKLFLLFLLLTFAGTQISLGQATPDYFRYMDEADNQSMLFKGRIAVRYPFKHQGTYFAYSDEYLKGQVRYNGKDYYDVYLNLDANLDEVSAKKRTVGDAIILAKSEVDFFYLGERKFMNIKEGNAVMPSGFFEVLYSDDKDLVLYKKTIKTYREDVSRDMGSTIIRFFEPTSQYFLVKGDDTYIIKNKASLLSVFKNRKKELKQDLSEIKIVPTSLYTQKEVLYQTILKSLEK